MAALLYLDVDDEITSAAARIRAATEQGIVLVLPHGSRLATSRINFRLLAREAEARGRTLEVVAPDAAARALAAAAGLTVHPSVAAFEAAAAGEPPAGAGAPPALEGLTSAAAGEPKSAAGAVSTSARSPRTPAPEQLPAFPDADPTVVLPSIRDPQRPRRRGAAAATQRPEPIPIVGPRRPAIAPRTLAIGLAGILIALLVGGAAAFTLLPSATIAVTPTTQSIGPLELTITAEPGVIEPDPAALVVPAQRFVYVVTATNTFVATGVRVDEAKAAGQVTFQNCDTGRRITILAGSVVATTAGVGFATSETIIVERATVKPFLACKVKSVGVVASLAGVDGNVAAGAISTIPPGYDPVVLEVTNEAPTSGGKHDEFPVITEADVEAALAALETALIADFDRQLADTSVVPERTQLFLGTKQLGESSPSVDPAPLIGIEQPEFELGLAAEGTVIGVDPAPVRALADARIRDEVERGFRLDGSTIVIRVGTPVVSFGTISYPVTVSARATRQVDADALVAAIEGLPLREARLILEAAGTVRIDLWPDWVTTIPTLGGRITLSIEGAP